MAGLSAPHFHPILTDASEGSSFTMLGTTMRLIATAKPAKYPNGRVFTDDVINYRLAFLTKNQCPPTGLKPHADTLKEFPYIGRPHAKKLAVG